MLLRLRGELGNDPSTLRAALPRSCDLVAVRWKADVVQDSAFVKTHSGHPAAIHEKG
jgi:hypothetical protein